jgi:hypothetical protein
MALFTSDETNILIELRDYIFKNNDPDCEDCTRDVLERMRGIREEEETTGHEDLDSILDAYTDEDIIEAVHYGDLNLEEEEKEQEIEEESAGEGEENTVNEGEEYKKGGKVIVDLSFIFDKDFKRK